MKELRLLFLCCGVLPLAVWCAVVAATAQEQIERRLRRVGATREETQAGRAPRLWAVIIGVSVYKLGDREAGDGDVIRNLKNAADDAQAVHDFLRSDAGGGFRDVKEGGRMTLHKDDAATKENVSRALNDLKQSQPDDFFVIYIAAHGALIPQFDQRTQTTVEVPYFILHDTDLNDAEKTGLRMETFRKLIADIPARKGLVLSDTCHSAGVLLAGRNSNAALRANARYLEEMKQIHSGVGFISAADQTESSREMSELGHGVFTHFLLEALRGHADGYSPSPRKEVEPDGVVTFKEVKEYLRDHVPARTNNRQHPQYGTTSLETNEIPLAVIAYRDENECRDRRRCGTLLLRAPDLPGVEVTVDGVSVGKLKGDAEHNVNLAAGAHKLAFIKGGVKRERETRIEPGQTKIVEINLTFSEGEEESLDGATTRQETVYLRDAEPSAKARALLIEGVEQFNKQRFARAIESFTRAAQADGGQYPDAFVYRGRAEQSLGRKAEAIESFKRALAGRPQDYETETLLAEARFDAGDNLDEIISVLRRIADSHPNYDFAHVVLADVYFSRREPILAERHLKRAIRIKPKSPPAHLILADVLTHQADPAKRREAVKEAELALHLFEELSRKQVSVSRGLRFLSISHVIFGGGRYLNAAAMAEAHYTRANTLTRLVEFDEQLDPAEARVYLERAGAEINQALPLARAGNNKLREAMLLCLNAKNYWLKSETRAAGAEAERALELAEDLHAADLQADAHFTLHLIHDNDQKFDLSYHHLRQFITLASPGLSQEELKKQNENLENLRRKAQANRKIK